MYQSGQKITLSMTIVTAAAAAKEDLIEMGAPHLISMYDSAHCTVLSHASIANFSNLMLMCFFEKFRLF